jgi:AcrR family transcriptional regulator
MSLIVDPAKKDTKLPRVMRAALKLFVEKGIDGTTTKELARKAGVAEGALYRHFKSKNALAWHIFSTHLNAFTLDLMARVGREKTARRKIRAYISYCFESFEEDRHLFTYLILSEHRELKRFPVTHVHPGHAALGVVQEGQKRGELRAMDAHVAASLLVGSVIRLCLVRIYNGIAKDLRSHADAVSECLWDSLRKKK